MRISFHSRPDCLQNRFFKDEDGATAVVVAVCIVVLMGVAALVVDAGALYSERRQIQTAADAAALAGVQDLPGNPAAAVATADSYATLNAPEAIQHGFQVRSTYGANDTLEAEIEFPDYGLFFARFLGRDSAPVGARAVAVISSPVAFGQGVMPFGVMAKEPSATAAFGYAFNELVTLKQPAGEGESGNFQFLALTDPPGGHYGASDITNALSNGGVPNPVYINTLYNTKPGINGKLVSKALNEWIAGDTCSFGEVVEVQEDDTVKIVDPDCHRVIVCPVIVNPGPPVEYNWYNLQGTSQPIMVIGFSYFYIEGVGTTGNDCWVSGRFIRPVGPDDDVWDWGPVDPYGALSFRLVE